MRNTGPVTGKEIKLSTSDQLVTSTDTKGVITFCNTRFCEIAGYDESELLGQAHNIIRHPDMPPAAFAKMWQDLKAGRAWMGLVKNRCANGDHYWVDAYVTPVKERGQVVGYESVRVAPSQQQIDRAEEAYEKIRAGREPVSLATRWVQGLLVPTRRVWQYPRFTSDRARSFRHTFSRSDCYCQRFKCQHCASCTRTIRQSTN